MRYVVSLLRTSNEADKKVEVQVSIRHFQKEREKWRETDYEVHNDNTLRLENTNRLQIAQQNARPDLAKDNS